MSTLADALTLLIAIGVPFFFRFVGVLFVSEVILALLLPVLAAVRLRMVFRPSMRVIFVLLGFWLCGQIFSDALRRTNTVDWLRGNALIVFFAIDLIGLAALLGKNERRKVIFASGFALSTLLAAWFEPALDLPDDPWKWGYSTGANLAAVLISTYLIHRRLYLFAGIVFAGIVFVNLFENYRSPVLFFLITVALTMPVVPERIGVVRILPRAGSAMRIVVLAGFAVGAAWSASTLVSLVTVTGLVGEGAQGKNRAQKYSRGGIILGARPEILVSSQAAMESPIIGHGSWAKDPKYVEMLYDMQVENGIKMNRGELQEAIAGVIPAHSYLMQAWVWAGILGAIFWVYVLWMVCKAIIKIAILLPPLAPLYVWLLVSFIWAIMFSPFGNTARTVAALNIVIVVDFLEGNPTRGSLSRRKIQTTRWRRSVRVHRSALKGVRALTLSGNPRISPCAIL